MYKFEHLADPSVILYVPHTKEQEIYGWFDRRNDTICLNNTMSPWYREVTYFHEDTHRDCWDNKCKCWNTVFWCEYHAFRGEFDRVRVADEPLLTIAYIDMLQDTVSTSTGDEPTYGKALCRFLNQERVEQWFNDKGEGSTYFRILNTLRRKYYD